MAGTSQYMKREYVDLYTEYHGRLLKILNRFKIPKARFLRECVNAVLDDPELLKITVANSKKSNYRSRNSG